MSSRQKDTVQCKQQKENFYQLSKVSRFQIAQCCVNFHLQYSNSALSQALPTHHLPVTVCSTLLVSEDQDSQVQSKWIKICTYFSVVLSNIKDTSIHQIKEKHFWIAVYFPPLWNCNTSLLVGLPHSPFGIKGMSLLLTACFKTPGLKTAPWRPEAALKSGKLWHPTELLEKSFSHGI